MSGFPHTGQFPPARARLLRVQADAALAVAVEVVLALLGVELDGAQEARRRCAGRDVRPCQVGSMSRRFASRPRLAGEWASELETRRKRSSALHRQFIGGVRREARLQGEDVRGEILEAVLDARRSPDLEPNRENHGVQMCAGMRKPSGAVSRRMASRSFGSRPRMGRPSEATLPIARQAALLSRRASSRVGTPTRLCTLRTGPCFR